MKNKIALTSALLSMLMYLTIGTASAQFASNSQGTSGDYGRSGYQTNMMGRADARTTSENTPQARWGLPQAGFGGTAMVFGTGGMMRNGLPKTTLDSFVLNAGGHAEHIYGDEGANGLPPYFEFTKPHRIETGITGERDRGITTGHGSTLPDAWGGDEFVDGPEFTHAGHGPNNNFANWNLNIPAFGRDRTDMGPSPGAVRGAPTPNGGFAPRQGSTPHGSFGFNVP